MITTKIFFAHGRSFLDQNAHFYEVCRLTDMKKAVRMQEFQKNLCGIDNYPK
jgi:hypothetical protein